MVHRRAFVVALLILVVALGVGGPARAQTSTNYDLSWHVIGGGGQAVNSAHYAVNSTVGQGAASPPLSVSAHYAVSGGFWLPGGYYLYLPLALRAAP